MERRTGKDSKRVAVVGGGLVGALNACYLANRGFAVDLYELRQDIRTVPALKGRSINLALSHRGIEALKAVDLSETILQKAIAMNGRMIHNLDWSKKPIPYGNASQWINSVDRRLLNEILLTAAEHKPNVTMYFEHKLIAVDFDNNKMSFKRQDQSVVAYTADLIVGCDGAFSETRRQFMKSVRLDYDQKYIEHGYMELTIPPTDDGQFAMDVNYLHIWPRNEYMMIALPNIDKSYTVTLFMPFAVFELLKTETQLIQFFRENFPDSINLIGEDDLAKMFFASSALPLITVKCWPYHIRDCAVIMGDAAHAMVPFYGQGMNCGFEDCLIFDTIMNENNNDFKKTLEAYTDFRSVDASAICDLALYNYIEMRSHVNSPWFLLRKKLDNFLYWIIPSHWVPLYTMVSFTRIRYSECISKRKSQDKVVRYIMFLPLLGVVVAWVGFYRPSVVDRFKCSMFSAVSSLASRVATATLRSL